ncbi:unnamed protein product [Owenia fusiformis]|uniref:Protein-PII uridylyltransferase N-terminal domain-containing protein n=1 Tax=Owenia fusiformis TaxID=6347 RepID=A0A8S4PXT3_OWEFU|nr:unnamed protein product [Owenia fusiformis]
MGNSLTQWRSAIGTFSGNQSRLVVLECSTGSDESQHTASLLVIITMLLVIGGIEMDPGPNQSKSEITQKMYDLGCKIKACDQETELKKQAELMCELGDEFIGKAETSPTWYEHFVWASALLNAAKCRLEKLESRPFETIQDLLRRWSLLNTKFKYDKCYIEERLQDIDTQFLKRLSKARKLSTHDLTSRYKQELEKIRTYSEDTVNAIINNDMIVHPLTSEMREQDIDNTIEHSKVFYNELTEKILEFYRSIIIDCMSTLGIQNCKYKFAIMALGSLSRKEVTAYSDIEWAILFDPMGEPVECIKEELRMLVYYVHLQILNLGETILNNLDIPVLTDFNDRLPPNMTDVDFWDEVTTRGVSFDGTHPSASKTPIGRKSRKDPEKPPTLELIMTIDEMTKYQFNDVSLKEGYRLSDVLMNSALITGDETLWETYNKQVHSILESPSKNPNVSIGTERGIKTLNDDLAKYLTNPLTSKSFCRDIHTKHDVYRLATISINILKLVHGCKSFAPLDVLEELFKNGILTERAKKDLQTMVCIASNLRHLVYSKYKEQKEFISFLSSESKDDTLDSKTVIPVRGYTAIITFYTTFVPWSKFLVSQKNNMSWKHKNKYTDDSNKIKVQIYKDMYFSERALYAYKAELEKLQNKGMKGYEYEIALLQYEIGSLYQTGGKFDNALKFHVDSLSMCRKVHGNDAHPDVASLLNNIGRLYVSMGEYTTARKYYEDSLSMFRKIYGNDAHPDVASSMNNIGGLYNRMGEYTTARKYYEDSLSMLRKIHGNDAHPDVASSMSNIGNLYNSMGEYTTARKYYEDSLSMLRKIHGNDAHPDVASLLNNIGRLYVSMGEYTTARKYYEDSLSMFRKIYGNDAHPDVASSMSNIGELYFRMGEYTTARKYYEDGLSMLRKIHGNDAHPDVASSVNNIGGLYNSMGEYTTARKYYEDSLSMYRKVHGNDAHPDVAMSMNNLGEMHKQLGEYTTAMKYYEDSLSMRRKIHGSDAHPDIAGSMNNIGGLYNSMGEYTTARKYLEDSLSMYRKIHGNDAHPYVAMSMNNIGGLYNSKGEYTTARRYYEDSLSMRRKIHGNDAHPDVAMSMNNLGEMHKLLGEYTTAMKYYEDSLSMRRKIHGNDAHPDVAMSMNNLGEMHKQLGEYTTAMKYYEDSLSMRRKIHGSDAHPDIAGSMNNIGGLYNSMGEYTTARKYLEDSLSMYRKIHGNDAHPYVAMSMNNIGGLYNSKGEYTTARRYYEDSLSMRRKIHGNDAHPDVAMSMNNLGEMHKLLGEYTTAMKYYEDSLSMLRKIHGNDAHPYVASSLNNIGGLYYSKVEYTTARKYFEDSLSMLRKIHGNEAHPDAAVVLNNIRDVQKQLGLLP